MCPDVMPVDEGGWPPRPPVPASDFAVSDAQLELAAKVAEMAANATPKEPIISTPEERLLSLFTYHPPTDGQPAKYNALREGAYSLAMLIHNLCPPSADRTAAIRCVREAIMWANASIANDGVTY